MGRATALGEASSNRGDAILREALALFAQRGLHATSMRDIAQAVGLTEGTLYHYYASKAEIVAAIVERNFFSADEIAATLARVAARPLAEQLTAVADSFQAVLREHRAVTAFFLSEGSRLAPAAASAKIAERFYALFSRRVERLAEHLAAQKPRGNPRLLAAHFFDSIGSFWILEAIVAKQPPSSARWRSYVESIVGLIVANCTPAAKSGLHAVKSSTRKGQWRSKAKA
jgi:AcrR family transcriptional regulator